MVWDTLEFGNRFHFILETCGKRVQVMETIRELCQMEDPTQYPHHAACPVHFRHVIKVKNTNLLLLFNIHGDDDPVQEHRHAIELVNIIDPSKL